MANILSIAKSGLAAAQVGMATTGHNIANQKTAGYSRQLVIQTAVGGSNQGVGYVGNGTAVQTVQRVYNTYLATQAMATQSSASQYATYYEQVSQINNLIADSSFGLSSVLQDFFTGLQDLVANPGTAASRQSMLSSAETLAARFNSLSSQLQSMQQGVNEKITASVTTINAYAQQIAQLNEAIAKAQNGTGQQPNDLLDQRDLLVAELSKEVKVTVVQQDSGYNVFIGNGQPLVVGNTVQELVVMPSSTDPGRLQVGYNVNGNNILLPESAFTGGNLGGLFEYRSQTLDQVQNALGRIAIGLASVFNEQHELGLDQNGNLGTAFFNVADPLVLSGSGNSAGAAVSATFTDVGALTTNNYKLSFDGTNYRVTQLPDNVAIYNGSTFPDGVIEGLSLSLDGAMVAGDEFEIRPTANGASNFSVLIKDTSLIAAASPVVTAATTGNTGTGAISSGTVNAAYTQASLASALTLTYSAADGSFTATPARDISVTVNGVTTTYAAGTSVPYTAGATISFDGVEVQISGTPAEGDTFTIGANVSGGGDNRNALLLGELQTKNVLLGGTANFNSAYSQIVSQVGNKTRELQINSEAEATLLAAFQTAQQSESGVNLDEEAANLLQYQQAYQASARVMQAVSDMFDVLISLGR